MRLSERRYYSVEKGSSMNPPQDAIPQLIHNGDLLIYLRYPFLGKGCGKSGLSQEGPKGNRLSGSLHGDSIDICPIA